MSFRTEPAVLISFVSALVGLLIAVGLLSSDLRDPINLVVVEFVSLLVVSGLIIRSQVTPAN
jgi:high-affinity Fe2+/Pb2+ permease